MGFSASFSAELLCNGEPCIRDLVVEGARAGLQEIGQRSRLNLSCIGDGGFKGGRVQGGLGQQKALMAQNIVPLIGEEVMDAEYQTGPTQAMAHCRMAS